MCTALLALGRGVQQPTRSPAQVQHIVDVGAHVGVLRRFHPARHSKCWFHPVFARDLVGPTGMLSRPLVPSSSPPRSLVSSSALPAVRARLIPFSRPPVPSLATQSIDDQLMFGPDYMLTPQLLANATERSVYLSTHGGAVRLA